MWRKLLVIGLLLGGCAPGPEARDLALYPTPEFKPTESARYYYQALAHHKVHEHEETEIFARLALNMFEQEKAEPRQIRLARQLYAESMAESGQRDGALQLYQALLQQYPRVPGYQKAVKDLSASR